MAHSKYPTPAKMAAQTATPASVNTSAKPNMSEQSAIDTAVKRLAMALDALDAAVERRREGDRNEDTFAAQVQTLGSTAPGWPPRSTARPRARASWNRPTATSPNGSIAPIASIQSVLEGDGE